MASEPIAHITIKHSRTRHPPPHRETRKKRPRSRSHLPVEQFALTLPFNVLRGVYRSERERLFPGKIFRSRHDRALEASDRTADCVRPVSRVPRVAHDHSMCARTSNIATKRGRKKWTTVYSFIRSFVGIFFRMRISECGMILYGVE